MTNTICPKLKPDDIKSIILQNQWNRKVPLISNTLILTSYNFHNPDFIHWRERPCSVMVGNGTNKHRIYELNVSSKVFVDLLRTYFNIKFTDPLMVIEREGNLDQIFTLIDKFVLENHATWIEQIVDRLTKNNLDPKTNMGDLLLELFRNLDEQFMNRVDEILLGLDSKTVDEILTLSKSKKVNLLQQVMVKIKKLFKVN